jgi:hypothetical protein
VDMLYISSFMKTGTGIQALLRFCLKLLEAAMLVLLAGSHKPTLFLQNKKSKLIK